MLIKVDLSNFVSNSTKYALVSIDLEAHKTVKDVVNYLVQLFNFQHNGNILLFSDEWFIHGCQPSSILLELNTIFRLDVEEQEQTKHKKENRHKRQVEENILDNYDESIETNSHHNIELAEKEEEIILENNVNQNKKDVSVSLLMGKTIVKKRKHKIVSENIKELDDSKLSKNIPYYLDMESEISLDIDQSYNKTSLDMSDCIDFSVPLKKKRTRKHNKSVKREKRNKRRMTEIDEAVESKNKEISETNTKKSMSLNHYTEMELLSSNEESIPLLTHRNPAVKKNRNNENFINGFKDIYATPIKKYNTDAISSRKVTNSELLRGPPSNFTFITKPTVNDECTFSELIMLQNSIYPVTLEPIYSPVQYGREFNTNITDNFVNTPDDKLDKNSIATRFDNPASEIKAECTSGFKFKGTDSGEENNSSVAGEFCNNNMRKRKANDSINKSKIQNFHIKRKKIYNNSIGSILEMLRARENESSDENSVHSNAENCATIIDKSIIFESTNGRECDMDSYAEDISLSGETAIYTQAIIQANSNSPSIIDIVGDSTTNTSPEIVVSTPPECKIFDKLATENNVVDQTSTNSEIVVNNISTRNQNEDVINVIPGSSFNENDQEIQHNTETSCPSLKDAPNILNIDTTKAPNHILGNNNLQNPMMKSDLISNINLEMHPIIKTLPKLGDIIGFKTMTLDESYCPVYSEYQIGIIQSLSGPIISLDTEGPFDVRNLQNNYNDLTEIDFREMYEVRLLFP